MTKAEQLNSNRIKPVVSQKNKDRAKVGLGTEIKHNRIKEVAKHTNTRRGSVLMPYFTDWIRKHYADKGLEIHHFYGSSMGKFDCFITIIHHTTHTQIHHGDIGVKRYIHKRGEHILIAESMGTIQLWLDDPLTSFEMVKMYQPLVDSILNDLSNAKELAKSFFL